MRRSRGSKWSRCRRSWSAWRTSGRCARLAAGGASNRDIAATLTVSVKTVEATLTRGYRKLGLHSRVQLAYAVTPVRE
ncbi:response regulator transcription factor [Kitasatospora phosalacinea]|uniref:response regulator transcription factor n=1 Tax=Kitasatospora phosalacinea TaxID=2065 RepID=UPI003CC91697